MPYAEFVEWAAFQSREPIGEERRDTLAGLLACMLGADAATARKFELAAQAWRAPKSKRSAVDPVQTLPDGDVQDADILKSFVAQFVDVE